MVHHVFVFHFSLVIILQEDALWGMRNEVIDVNMVKEWSETVAEQTTGIHACVVEGRMKIIW